MRPPQNDSRYMYIPPFIAKIWPVMYAASFEARNAMLAATSSGEAGRPSGTAASIASR